MQLSEQTMAMLQHQQLLQMGLGDSAGQIQLMSGIDGGVNLDPATLAAMMTSAGMPPDQIAAMTGMHMPESTNVGGGNDHSHHVAHHQEEDNKNTVQIAGEDQQPDQHPSHEPHHDEFNAWAKHEMGAREGQATEEQATEEQNH
jgi:hypothetical protein